MGVNNQFSIAVHLMAGLACRCDLDTTSGQLAKSVNTSPSFIRRVLAKLSKAGLVQTATGKGGSCWLGRKAEEITLRDIYQAVDAPKAFSIHDYAEFKACPVSRNIKMAMEKALQTTQAAMEESLAKITLASIVSDLQSQ